MNVFLPEHRNLFINGEWKEASAGEHFSVTNPASGAELCTVSNATASDATAAMDAATQAFPGWSGLTGAQRAAPLVALKELVAANLDSLAKIMTQEQGKPLGEAKGELSGCVEFIEWYAEEAKRVYGQVVSGLTNAKRQFITHRPLGPIAIITPWNFPALMILRKMSAALAAGCTVVVKPAEQTPLTAIAIFELIEKAGFPKGAANLVLSDDPMRVSDSLLNHPGLAHLTFTGSTAVGKKLASHLGGIMKPYSMELGGHAPFIVFPDADIDQAVADLSFIKFRNAGQTCVNPNRVFVHTTIKDVFIKKFTASVERHKVGSGFEDDTTVGPLIDADAVAKVDYHVKDAVAKGAKVVTGGSTVDRAGTFYAPTVITGVDYSMVIANEETFGPVAPLFEFSDEDDVWALANQSPYGLVAYVYTSSLEKSFQAAEKLEYGVVGVNDPRPGSAQTPFGGVKDSGVGREGGQEGMYEFMTTHSISFGVKG